jgi:divalent metal cation (Fe/Co/Zn/Cd) transporter
LDSLVALLIAIVVAYHALRLMRRAQIELRDRRSSHVEKSARPEASRQPSRREQGLD